MKKVLLALFLMTAFNTTFAADLGQDLGFEKCTEHVQSSRGKAQMKDAETESKKQEENKSKEK